MEENLITTKLTKFNVPKRFLNCSFENFKGNEKVVSVLKNLSLLKPFPDLILSGNVGCGKTHLSVALLREFIIAGHANEKKVKFIPVIELLLELRRSFDSQQENEFDIIKRYSQLDLLLLDDLGSEKISDWTISSLYVLLNNRYNCCRPTIITTNLISEQIEQTIGSRIASRLAEGRIIQIDMPDYRKQRR
jgi:DNA replication protein DnaC